MGDLIDDQAAMCLARCCEFPEGFEALTLGDFSSWNNGVADCLQLVEFDHDVAGQDGAELALAPSLVDVNQVLGGNAASFVVFGIP